MCRIPSNLCWKKTPKQNKTICKNKQRNVSNASRLFFKDLSLSHIKGHRKEAKGSSGCFVGKYNQKPPGHLCESYWGARFTFLIQTFSYLSKSLNATACCICSVRCKCTATCAAIRVLYNTCPLMHTYPHALCRHTLLVGESCVHS